MIFNDAESQLCGKSCNENLGGSCIKQREG